MIRSLLLLLAVGSEVFAQRSISDLAPAHARALERYLSANKIVSFRSDDNVSNEYLKTMSEGMGKGFKPSYAVGDFNRDKQTDFAVLLYREGKAVVNEGVGSEEHRTDRPMRLVVFNGSRAGLRVAYTTDLMGPDAAFITFDKKLYYGVFETDSDTFVLSPAGRGYVAKSQ